MIFNEKTMDNSRFCTQNDRFPLLDLTAQFDFKTHSSISFLIGKGTSCYFGVYGRAEIHHPCEGEFEGQAKVHIRIYLPTEYLSKEHLDETIRQTLKTLYTVLSIPEEDTHQVRFFEVGPKAYVVVEGEVRAYSPIL
jgi:hypothetical protein